MVDFVELNEKRAKYKLFLSTELGHSYHKYQNALIDYWRNDANERISGKRLRELDDNSREATKLFVAKLMELSGIK